MKISPDKSILNMTQNNLYPTKTIWAVQNDFGPIEVQGNYYEGY